MPWSSPASSARSPTWRLRSPSSPGSCDAGGELRFYEHVRSERPGFARYQDTIDHVWPRLMGGCHPNRDTLAAIRDAGFEVERVRRFGFPATARAYPVLPRILGSARAA